MDYPILEVSFLHYWQMFVYLGFYVAFNTLQVISRRVVGRAEETSTYSSLGFCTVNCRPTASNYQLSHLRPWRGSNPGCRGGRWECYHSATVAPLLANGTDLSKLQQPTTSLEKGFFICFDWMLDHCDPVVNRYGIFKKISRKYIQGALLLLNNLWIRIAFEK